MKQNQRTHRKNLLPSYLQGLVSGKYTLRQASESTGYTIRHLSNLKRRYKTEGLSCLDTTYYRGPPANKISAETELKILGIYATKYQDVNFRYFHDCLKEFEGIKLAYDTLRRIMQRAGVQSPERRKHKPKSVHRPRIRRQNEGDLIQIDGTPYAWFYKCGDNTRYCMVGAIDDTTGKITALYMTQNECLYGYMEILRTTCLSYGIPREIYSDRAAIFCVTQKNKKDLSVWEQLAGIHDKRTQWQRILSDLSINQILAWTPEAKGRIERLWRTLQGQLPQWFYLNGIKTVAEANKQLHKYIKTFNKKYAVEPAREDSFYRPVDDVNLDEILCAQFPKRTNSQGCFQFQGEEFCVIAPYKNVCHKRVLLCISEKGITARMDDGLYYPVRITSQYIIDCVGDVMPQVVKDIIYRYLLATGKELSA